MPNKITLNDFIKGKHARDQMTEILPKLPEGWRWVKLKEIAEFITKGTTPSTYGHQYKDSGIPFIRAENVVWGPVDYKSATLFISAYVPKGAPPLNINQAVALIRLKPTANPKFVSMILHADGVQKQMRGYQVTATISNLSLTQIKNLRLPLPPICEQERIVARIEELTARIEQAKKLREDALKETEKIMQTALHQTFKNPEQKGWKIRRLKEVAETTSGGTPRRSVKEYFGGGIPWVKSGELEDNIILKTEETISEEGLENSNAKLLPKGTLLVAMYGATVGKTGILGIEATTNQAICAIFPKEDIINKFFIRYFIIWKRQELIKNSFGGAQPNISQKVIRNLEIPVPPIEQQYRIVEYLDRLQEKIILLKEQQKSTQKYLESVTESILKKAFSGQL